MRNLLIAIVAMFIIGCNVASPFKKLEGKWTASGDQGEGHSWYLEYIFEANTYKMMGYPPLSESGTMKLKVANGDSLLIGFIVKKSDPHYENHDEWVVIKGNQILVNGIAFNKSN